MNRYLFVTLFLVCHLPFSSAQKFARETAVKLCSYDREDEEIVLQAVEAQEVSLLKKSESTLV
ncbi:hypothetical protein [Flavilitoribacter nigricans]|nr:hypothetical protein [Flavilitoribacter nigricans]